MQFNFEYFPRTYLGCYLLKNCERLLFQKNKEVIKNQFKKIGPIMELFGTTDMFVLKLIVTLLVRVHCFVFEKYESRQVSFHLHYNIQVLQLVGCV